MTRDEHDVRAEAMEALVDHLVLPKELEEQMLEAAGDARPARDADRGPATLAPGRRASRFAVVTSIAAVFAGVVLGGAAWLEQRRSPAESTVISHDATDAAERAARAVAAIDWNDDKPWQGKMALLDALRENIERLGDPAAIGRVAPRYEDGVRRGFLDAGKAALETALAAGSGAWALEEREYLKEYLLLADPARLGQEADWEVRHFVVVCAESVAASRHLKAADVAPIVAPHVRTLLALVERGLVRGPDLDEALVGRTREALSQAEPRRYYDVFVTPLVEAPRDPSGGASPDNLLYPPITLDASVEEGDATLVRSKNKKSWGTPYEVLGVYTGAARRAVFHSLDAALDELERDAWVAADDDADRRTREAVERVKGDYDGLYVHEWESFLRDVDVARPSSGKDGARTLRALAADDSPLARLLEVVVANTGPVTTRDLGAGDPVAQRFEALAKFLAADGPMTSYRALLTNAAEDAEAGRRLDRRELGGQVHALLGSRTEGGTDLLAPLLLAPFER